MNCYGFIQSLTSISCYQYHIFLHYTFRTSLCKLRSAYVTYPTRILLFERYVRCTYADVFYFRICVSLSRGSSNSTKPFDLLSHFGMIHVRMQQNPNRQTSSGFIDTLKVTIYVTLIPNSYVISNMHTMHYTLVQKMSPFYFTLWFLQILINFYYI